MSISEELFESVLQRLVEETERRVRAEMALARSQAQHVPQPDLFTGGKTFIND